MICIHCLFLMNDTLMNNKTVSEYWSTVVCLLWNVAIFCMVVVAVEWNILRVLCRGSTHPNPQPLSHPGSQQQMWAGAGRVHGRSQKWPKEGVLMPKIAKGGGFEGPEALLTRARTSFYYSFVKKWPNILGQWGVGGSDPHIPPWLHPWSSASWGSCGVG